MELRSARREGAAKAAESTYRRAETTLNSGWQEMARQKGRMAFLRDYHTADSLLQAAAIEARRAAGQARQRKDSARVTYVENQQLLSKDLEDWKEVLNGSLARNHLQHHYYAAELALLTGKRLADRGEYVSAVATLADARAALVELGAELARYATADSGKISLWRSWVEETLQESRRLKTHAVIVDKSAHKTYLVGSGKLIHTFDCNLGYNSSRQKLTAGDAATPEGKYRVTAVRPNGSKYYKALLLDYPNARDRSRFAENKATGVISAKAKIGGLIELHGHGGRDRDWTEGCVALADSDIDLLMKYADTGMAVTIVRRSDRWP